MAGWFNWLRRSETSPISRPATWLIEALGGARSGAGITVNRQKALGFSPVWAAVSIISADIARMPLHLFRRAGDDRQRDREHPIGRLLEEPNGEMSGYTFRRTLMAHALLHSNAFALWEPDEPALWPIDPEIVELKRDPQSRRLVYRIHTDRGVVEVEPERIFHLKGLSLDGTSGLSLIQFARESIAHGVAMRDYSARFFANSARPDLLFHFPEGAAGTDKTKETLKDFIRRWNEDHQGSAKAHKAAGIALPVTVEQIGASGKDSQLIEQLTWSIADCARFFGINPWFLGSSQASNVYSNRLSVEQEHRDRCLGPWLRNWEAEIQRTLLAGEPDLFAEFQRHDLLSMDPVERTNLLKAQIDAGILTVDEARRILNLGPMPEGAAQPQPQPQPQGGDPDED